MRRGSASSRYAILFSPGDVMSTVSSSEASDTGGSYVTGFAVTPHRKFPNGGPAGSTPMMPFTNPGRALA